MKKSVRPLINAGKGVFYKITRESNAIHSIKNIDPISFQSNYKTQDQSCSPILPRVIPTETSTNPSKFISIL